MLSSHLLESQSTFNLSKVTAKSDDDVVIVGLCRTALTKSKRGAQKDTPIEAMLKPVLKGVAEQANLDPKLVEDICVGNCLQTGAGHMTGRIGSILAGYPVETSSFAVNRLCSSGLQAVMNIANSIRNRQIDIGIGAGVENMSTFDMNNQLDPNLVSPMTFEHPIAQNCLLGMGLTSDNVALKFNISREK